MLNDFLWIALHLHIVKHNVGNYMLNWFVDLVSWIKNSIDSRNIILDMHLVLLFLMFDLVELGLNLLLNLGSSCPD